jgi:hypothetical protein
MPDATDDGLDMREFLRRRLLIGNRHPHSPARGRQRRAFALGNVRSRRLATDSVYTLLQYSMTTAEDRASFTSLGSTYGINESKPA